MLKLYNLIILIGTKFFTLLISLITQVFLAWFLGVEDRGAYAVIFTYVSTISFLFLIGLDISIVYFISSKKITISEGVIYSTLLILFFSVIAIICAIFLLKTNISFFDKAELKDFHLGLVQIPFTMMSIVTLNIFTAVNDYKSYSRITIFCGIVQVSLLFLLLRILEYGVTGAILSMFIQNILIISISLYYLKKRYGLYFISISKSKPILILKYGIKYYLGQINTVLTFQLPFIFLGTIATKFDIGIYSIASQLTARSMVLVEAIILILLPMISENPKNKEQIISILFKLVLILTGCFLAVVGFFAKEIIILLFGEPFIAGVVATQILCTAYTIRSTGKVFESYFLGKNKGKIITYSITYGLIAGLFILVVLFTYEVAEIIEIAAFSVLVSFIVSTIMLIIYYKNIGNVSYKNIIFFDKSDIIFLRTIFDKLTLTK